MPTAGALILASDVPARCGGRWRRVANQSVNTGSSTSIIWDTEDEDTDGFTAPDATITIPTGKSGIYGITFTISGAVDTPATFNGAGSRLLAIITTTTAVFAYPAEFRSPKSDGREDSISFSLPTLRLSAGDSFVCKAFHDSVAAVNFTAWLECFRVSV